MKKVTKIILGVVATLAVLGSTYVFLLSKDDPTKEVIDIARPTKMEKSPKKVMNDKYESKKSEKTKDAKTENIASQKDSASTENTSKSENATSTVVSEEPLKTNEERSSDPIDKDNPASETKVKEAGKGYWDASHGGTLELYESTPVYADKDKNGPIIFYQDAGMIDWDKYFIEEKDNWYSFTVTGEDGQVTRYYIAYSDVGH